MSKFDLAKFCSGMRDADRDLREMALFDLQQALRDPDFQFNEMDANTVTDLVLRCFSKDEPDKEVRNNAVQILPQFMLFCNQHQQSKMTLFLCSCATSEAAQLGEWGYSDIIDSSAFSLKLCCEIMADRARANVESWQQLLPVVQDINSVLVSKLRESSFNAVRDIIYDSVNALIDPFGRIYPCEIRDAMAEVAMLDFRGVSQLRRRAIHCLALLASLLSEDKFRILCTFAFGGLSDVSSSSRVLPHLQLCESLVRKTPLRVASDAAETASALLREIKRRTDQYNSEDDDVCDSLLRLMNCMVCQYSNELSPLHDAIFEQCVNLMNFDPNYCGDVEDENAYEDYYIEVEEIDMSWKLRKWSTKVLSSLMQNTPFFSRLIQGLKPEVFAAVRDRVEEVQLGCLQFMSVLTQHLQSGEAPLLVLGMLNVLLSCISASNLKVSVMAAKSLQLLFAHHGVTLTKEVARVQHVLTSLLFEKGKERISLKTEIIMVAQHVMGFALKDSLSISLAVELLQGVLNTIEVFRFDIVNDRILQAMKTMACIAQLAGAGYTERCMEVLFLLMDSKPSDAETSRAAVEAIGQCFPILYSALSESTVRKCLERVVSLAEINMNAAQVLCSMLDHCDALRVPYDLLDHLCKCVVNHGCSHQQSLICAVRDALKNGSELTAEALSRVIKFSQVDGLTSKEPLFIQGIFQMLNELCNKHHQVAERVVGEVLPAVWKALQAASLSSASVHARVVESAASLFRTLYLQLPQHRCALVEALLEHISSSTSPDIASDLLGEIAREENALIENVASAFAASEPMACLCVGTIGRYQPLSDAWKARIVSALTNSSSDTARRFGFLAMGRAASFPPNVSLLHTAVEHAVTDENDRYVYWRAIKEVTVVAAAQQSSSLSDHSFCKSIETRLIENVLEDDAETTAAVLGGFAPFNFNDLLGITESCLTGGSEGRTAACISTQRYLLAHCKHESCLVQLDNAISASLQYLKRTSGVQIRLAALQLFATVVSLRPQLLLTPIMRDAVYPGLLSELLEDSSLVLTINLGGYTHREDRGIEIRKLAFECMSILLRDNEQQYTGRAIGYYGRLEELLHCLVHASGPQQKGEVDASLNNQSKALLVQLVRVCPKLPWSESLITALCEKLKAALEAKNEGASSDAEKNRTGTRHTLNCIMRLSEHVPFTYIPQFQPLLLLAQQSPLLTESLRLVI
ncbi:hypothetical protein DQ04_00181210 [Trypanosoma grayi]|uniref:hypothetical protein n=1 Tax=Trypanosoma grayi TaxID=71804 RepID=UPI0004F3F60D|nr:hypothetical protein DQ04_00181210 [Trypanosoma grayi]KEG15128.1 hypothetical protein DQ04_00181210 [Trypanosoma grayi]